MHTAPDPLTLSVADVAAALGVSRDVVYAQIRRGRILALRLGHRLVVPTVQLQRFLDAAGNPSSGGREGAAGSDEQTPPSEPAPS